MPDQNSASTEHALIQELTAPLASLPDDPVPEVANVDFPVALRGYDRIAVDAYVKRTAQLVAELNAGRSPQAAVRRALERVGEDVSGILQRAHETAEQITAQSRIEGEDRLESARREADQLVTTARQEADALLSDARGHLTELDAETDRIWAERHRIVEDAHSLASQLLALAEAAVERFPAAEEPATEVEKPFDADDDGTLPGQADDLVAAPPEPRPEDEATVIIEPVQPLEHDAE
ncbi:MAG TPA: DivIVA domain-containing protein [Solirubrobacteraceae bacterium]|jgi:DivIVA domain-containing protein